MIFQNIFPEKNDLKELKNEYLEFIKNDFIDDKNDPLDKAYQE